jgi:choline dehydrogenase-like flavoprotein
LGGGGEEEMTNQIYGVDLYEKRAEKYKVITRDIVCDVDVCVIGSGAAGAILATKLAESGKSVALLEKGGYYDGESMNQREADMIPLLWKNAGANFTSNLRIAVAQGCCLGGSTVINDAVCFRIPEIVIDQWNKNGVSITKAEWDKANDEVSERIHVTEVTEEELNTNAKKLKEACEIYRIDNKPIKHSKNHRNCGQSFSNPDLHSCVKCGFCHIGCHYDTKQSMLVTYIHDALNNDKLNYTVYCNCQADKITHNNDGIATGIDGVFIDSSGNEKYRIRVNAKVIIVSAGSVASSNLLQKSQIGDLKVGKGVALHPAPFVIGHFKENIYGNRGIPMSYTCNQFGVTNGVENGGFLIESIFLPIFQMAIAIPTFAADHKRMMMEFDRYAMAGIMTRDEPTGRVSISYNGNPKLEYNLSTQTIDSMARGMAIVAKMWFDVGATSVITSHIDIPEIKTKADIPNIKYAVRNNPNGLLVGSAHPQGGNRMGDDREECIVDSDCKVFGFNNLYVCDASVFPTALGVNPQLTVMALATITANKIIKNWTIYPLNKLSTLGNTCNISQPRFCRSETIGDMFVIANHNTHLFSKLGNSMETKPIVGENWRFDREKLIIYNDLFWKGMYGIDNNIITNLLRYIGGFYKKFWKVDDTKFRGITHPFETQLIDAKSIAMEKELPGFGKVIHLEYDDIPYSYAYDLLKMVDENTILGKAFIGPFGKGRELFNFSMSRVYDIEFMTENDLFTLFNNKDLSHIPTESEVKGVWEGMLVSDSAVTPRTQIFYFDYEDGQIDMRYSFANMLRGRSNINITDRLFRLDDQTPFHDEIRMVTPNLIVGRWVTEWSSEDVLKPYYEDFKHVLAIPIFQSIESAYRKLLQIFSTHAIRLPKEAGPSFLNVEIDEKNRKTRLGLSYILKRIG